MWESEWYWDEETGDEYELPGEWVLMDEYDALFNKEMTDYYYSDNPFSRIYTAGEPGWWTLDIDLGFSRETGEVYAWDPPYLSTELPADGSDSGGAYVMTFIY